MVVILIYFYDTTPSTLRIIEMVQFANFEFDFANDTSLTPDWVNFLLFRNL